MDDIHRICIACIRDSWFFKLWGIGCPFWSNILSSPLTFHTFLLCLGKVWWEEKWIWCGSHFSLYFSLTNRASHVWIFWAGVWREEEDRSGVYRTLYLLNSCLSSWTKRGGDASKMSQSSYGLALWRLGIVVLRIPWWSKWCLRSNTSWAESLKLCI